MNELQQVLLVFAIVVIAVLYFMSRNKQLAEKKKQAEQNAASQSDVDVDASQVAQSYKKQASKALNDLGDAHIPVSQSTENRFSKTDEEEIEFNKNQQTLSFGTEFEFPKEEMAETKPESTQPQKKGQASLFDDLPDDEQSTTADVKEDVLLNEMGGRHHVLEVDDPGLSDVAYQKITPERERPSFGIPPEEQGKSPGKSTGSKKDPEAFVIMVMSAGQAFPMVELNKALLGVGLTYTDNAIYVKRDNMGNSIIKVANLMEPGIFPSEELESYDTPGVAMILELPTTVRAPGAMHDLIMMARKISQRMQGRLYNMDRQLIKESDLQAMRDAALEYESDPI